MGTAQASAVAIAGAARRGMPVALHTPSEVKAAVTGSGRADKAQVGAMVTRLLRLDAPPQAGRRRRRPGAGDLPHLARAAQATGSPRPLAGPAHARAGAAGDRLRQRPGRRARPRTPRSSRSAASAWPSSARPRTLADAAASASRPRSPPRLVVREDSLTLYGFADDDEREVFELLQTASGVGPRLAQAMLAVHAPDALRRAVATEDLAALTAVPGHRHEGRPAALLELKDRLGAPVGCGARPSPARPARRRPAGATRCTPRCSASAGRRREADEAVGRGRRGRGRRRERRPDVAGAAALRPCRPLSRAR